MHVPNPLGRLPLTLRDSSIENPRKGELLLNYTNLDLIYTDKSGNKKRLAESIYQQIIAAKIENNKIIISHIPEDTSTEEPVIPDVGDRTFNAWYMNITKREVRSSDEDETSESI